MHPASNRRGMQAVRHTDTRPEGCACRAGAWQPQCTVRSTACTAHGAPAGLCIGIGGPYHGKLPGSTQASTYFGIRGGKGRGAAWCHAALRLMRTPPQQSHSLLGGFIVDVFAAAPGGLDPSNADPGAATGPTSRHGDESASKAGSLWMPSERYR
eukprot:jgi/Ulvmu1/12787/UM097_0014.1